MLSLSFVCLRVQIMCIVFVCVFVLLVSVLVVYGSRTKYA